MRGIRKVPWHDLQGPPGRPSPTAGGTEDCIVLFAAMIPTHADVRRLSPRHDAQFHGGLDARERGDPWGAAKKVLTAPARRELVRRTTTKGLSERRSLQVIGMSARAGAWLAWPSGSS
jgi:hypothetical protein